MNTMYSKLRGLLKERCVDAEYLAKKLHLNNVASISYRMSGRTPWRIDEIYIVLDLCKISHDQMHLYFPKDGKSVEEPRLRIASEKTA